uniref:Zinc finger protein 512 n=1 Tax=Capra hircus TaxID=9925 RepID=A0A452FPN1_CAPHI
MSSRLRAVPATPGPTPFKQQRHTRIMEAKNSRTQCSIKDNSFQSTIPHDDSLSGSSSASDFLASFQKSTYWMKMRRIKSATASHVEGSDGVSTKEKRKPRQEGDEDYQRIFSEEFRGAVVLRNCSGEKDHRRLKETRGNCKQEMFTCQHCGEQLRSQAGMKYHVMANHNSFPILKAGDEIDEPSERELLKKLGKLRCVHQSCSSSFTSTTGYLYHVRKCGKGAAELEKMTLQCHHCGKPYRLKTGLVYHFPMLFFPESGQPECLKDMSLESKGGGRVQRQIAVFHLQELASAELAKEWPKRKVLQDLVPDDRKLKYTRPGLLTFSREKSDIKKYHLIQCPNQGCEAVYSSVSGLKAHLGSCTLGTFVAGKYKCLLCQKEFVSENGVRYHIDSVHSENWFVVNPTTTESFEKLQEEEKRRTRWFLRWRLRVGKDQRRNREVLCTYCREPEQEPVPTQFQKIKSPETRKK